MLELYSMYGRNTAVFVPALKRLLTDWPSNATTAADLLK
jgi:hypothetical protein